MKTADKKRKNLIESVMRFMQKACSVSVFIYLFLMAVFFPFYLTAGYRSAGTDKSMLFRFLGLGFLIVCLPCALICWICQWRKEGTKTFIGKISDSDWLAVAYLLVTVVSYLCTDNREEALWGAGGWYVGFVTQMIYLASFFFISRFLKGQNILIPLFAVSSSISFVLGVLNRFSVYPIVLEGANPSFIATLGNINWFCGYWSVFFSLAVGLFYMSLINEESTSGKKFKTTRLDAKRLAYRFVVGLYLVLSTAAGAVQGSDSAILVFVAVTLVLFCVSCKSNMHRKAFYVTIIVMCGTCQMLYVVRVIFPKAMNYNSITAEFLTGGKFTLFAFLAALLFWVLFHRLHKSDVDIVKILRKGRLVILGILIVSAVIFLGLLIKNTLYPGSIGVFSENPIFTFNEKWGSSRGATWTAGLKVFNDMPFGRKLIGLGPDSFAYGVYKEGSSAAQMVVEIFGKSRLTNAHNEWLTVLVNTGILGLLSYMGLFFCKTIRYIKSDVASSIVFGCGLALIGYMSNNLFSFQQVLNGPFVFIMMGIGEATIRDKRDSKGKKGK